MQVKQYIYQSPYSSPVQMGRVDPNSVKDESTTKNSDTTFTQTQTQKEAQSFQSSAKEEVKPTVSSERTLDVYA